MKRTMAMIGGLFAIAGLLIVGCSKNNGPVTDNSNAPPAGVTNETQAMQSTAMSDPYVQNDELTFADQNLYSTTTDYTSLSKTDTAITPLRWGRFISSITRTDSVTVAPGDSIAVVHVQRLVSGTLRIKGIVGTGDTEIVSKPFTDRAIRNVVFRRFSRDPKKFWQNWVPVATSLVDGATFPPPATNAIAITQLQALTSSDSITVTDPTSFYLRYWWAYPVRTALWKKDVLNLTGGDKITLRATVVSASADTDIVVLRYGFPVYRRRLQMTLVSEVKNPDNTYTRVYQISWNAHFFTGYFDAGVDAISRSTLFDNAAPYSVSWWGIPYHVR